MKRTKINLRKLITTELLNYSWLDLKYKQKHLFNFFDIRFSEPLSRNWLNKISLLLTSRNYIFYSLANTSKNFSKNSSIFSFRKGLLKILKFKILENAFLLLIKSYLFRSTLLQNINLTECLRL